MRQPAKYAVTRSANSQALRDDHYRHDEAAKRGQKDAMADAQEVALPPHDLRPDIARDGRPVAHKASGTRRASCEYG